MDHKKHSSLMIGLLVVGAVLFFSGFLGGGGILLLWLVGCMAMMFLMMRGMNSMSGGDRHEHDAHQTGKDDAPKVKTPGPMER